MPGKICVFLEELRNSSDRINEIFTKGSCTRLFFILNVFYPKAELYWSDSAKHAITKIKRKYYDINGIVSDDYVRLSEYSIVPKGNYHGYHLMKHTESKSASIRVSTRWVYFNITTGIT